MRLEGGGRKHEGTKPYSYTSKEHPLRPDACVVMPPQLIKKTKESNKGNSYPQPISVPLSMLVDSTSTKDQQWAEQAPFSAQASENRLYISSKVLPDPQSPSANLQLMRIDFSAKTGKVTSVFQDCEKKVFRPLITQFPETTVVRQTLEMTEEGSGIPLEINSPKEAYMKLLLTDAYPDSPKDLPDVVYMPPELTHFVEDLIFATRSDQRERGQIVKWSQQGDIFAPGKVMRGANLRVREQPLAQALLNDTLLAFGRQRLFMRFHTHPDNGLPFFSKVDIFNYLSHYKPAFINMVGSRDCIYTLFSTRQIQNAISKAKLEKLGYDELAPSHCAKVLEQLGVGVYEWRAERPVEKGDIANGVILSKIK